MHTVLRPNFLNLDIFAIDMYFVVTYTSMRVYCLAMMFLRANDDREVIPKLTKASASIIRQYKARWADALEAPRSIGAGTKETDVGIFITFIYIWTRAGECINLSKSIYCSVFENKQFVHPTTIC